jgi:hypothetical protein
LSPDSTIIAQKQYMDIKSFENVIKEINKIGNYAIPTFGAFLTSVLAMGPFSKESPKGYMVIIYFALYTLLAAFVSYWHRLAWLRRQHAQKERSEKPSDLSTIVVCAFMFLHFLLIATLSWRLWCHGVL